MNWRYLIVLICGFLITSISEAQIRKPASRKQIEPPVRAAAEEAKQTKDRAENERIEKLKRQEKQRGQDQVSHLKGIRAEDLTNQLMSEELLKVQLYNDSSTGKSRAALMEQNEQLPVLPNAVANQIIQGQEKIHQQASTVVADFLQNHIADEYMESSFCDYAIEKVCQYYGVDRMKLQINPEIINPALRESIIAGTHQMAEEANTQMNHLFDQWKEKCNIPTWNEFAKGKSNKQVLSLLTIMAAHSDGQLPLPIGSDDKYLYYQLGIGEKLARVSKEGASMDIASSLPERQRQSMQHFVQNGAEGDPLLDVINLFPEQRNTEVKIGFRTYDIATDGTGSQSYLTDDGKTVKSTISRPRVAFKLSDNTISLRNDFSEKVSTPWVFNPKIKPIYELSFPGSIVSTGQDGFNVGYELGAGTSYMKVSANDETLRVEGGKSIGVGRGAVFVGAKRNKNKNTTTPFMGVKGEIGLDGAKIGVEGQVDIVPGKTIEHISSYDNVVYNCLPSDLQERLIDELFNDASLGIQKYEDGDRVVQDIYVSYVEPTYITPSERESIYNRTKENIRSNKVPDISIAPTHTHLFEANCLESFR